MSETLTFTKQQARKCILHAHGLHAEKNTLTSIQKLGYLQIDTLSVTERAHHHVLFSRNPNYHKSELHDLMQQQKIFEYWGHAASYLPMEDYRYSLIRKKRFEEGDHHWFEKDKKWMKYVLDRIEAEGPLRSVDFKNDKKEKGEWYDWKPAKNALEQLFMEGKLMVKERKNFQKVYDLTERVLPADVDTSMPTQEEYFDHLIEIYLKANVLAKAEEISYLRSGIKNLLQHYLLQQVEEKKLMKIEIEGEYYYTKNTELWEDVSMTSKVHILNPFDPLIIQRKRLETWFNFSYQIECYVPEVKRKFGYYVLPILYRDRFVGRLDAKADRKTGVFMVKKIWFEPEFKVSDEFDHELGISLMAFAHFCGCTELER